MARARICDAPMTSSVVGSRLQDQVVTGMRLTKVIVPIPAQHASSQLMWRSWIDHQPRLVAQARRGHQAGRPGW
jgi:hypothetical protein